MVYCPFSPFLNWIFPNFLYYILIEFRSPPPFLASPPLPMTEFPLSSCHWLPGVPQVGLGFFFYPPPHVHAWVLSGVSLGGTCACCHHRWEFIWVTAHCLENTVSLWSFTTSGAYNLLLLFLGWFLSFGRQKLEIGVLFRNKHSAASFFEHWQVVGLCVKHHLLHEEASLVRVEKCVHLWG